MTIVNIHSTKTALPLNIIGPSVLFLKRQVGRLVRKNIRLIKQIPSFFLTFFKS